MSKLDIHRAAEKTEENEAAEVIEENQDVAEPELDSELPEGEPEEEAGEFELIINGGEEEPEPEPEYDTKAILHKLGKQRKRAQSAESENEELRKRLEMLESRMTAPQQQQPQAPQQPQFEYGSPAPVPPDKYSSDINGDDQKYAQAYSQYMRNWRDWEQAQTAPKRQDQQQQDKLKEMNQRNAEALAEDAKTLIKEKKVKQDVLVDAIQSVSEKIDGIVSQEGAFNTLAASLVTGGGARLAYALNNPKNAAYLNKLTKIIEEDPSGLKAASYATDLVNKMSGMGGKKISNAPDPDEPVRGDGKVESTRAADLQAKYDKATDFKEVSKLRKQAKELGITLVNQ